MMPTYLRQTLQASKPSNKLGTFFFLILCNVVFLFMLYHVIARTIYIKMISHLSHNLNSNTHLSIHCKCTAKKRKKEYKIK